MNHISQLLPPSNVIIDLDVASKKRVFEQAGLLFENTFQIARNQVFDSLFARENWDQRAWGRVLQFPTGALKDCVRLLQLWSE